MLSLITRGVGQYFEMKPTISHLSQPTSGGACQSFDLQTAEPERV